MQSSCLTGWRLTRARCTAGWTHSSAHALRMITTRLFALLPQAIRVQSPQRFPMISMRSLPRRSRSCCVHMVRWVRCSPAAAALPSVSLPTRRPRKPALLCSAAACSLPGTLFCIRRNPRLEGSILFLLTYAAWICPFSLKIRTRPVCRILLCCLLCMKYVLHRRSPNTVREEV